MKIYIYEFYRIINSAEAEVVEKPNTYRSADGKDIPLLYRRIMKKDDVGHLVGYDGNKVFYLEPNEKAARELFASKVRVNLKAARSNVETYEEQLKYLENGGN